MNVSVVIPAHNEENNIESLLICLNNGTKIPDEIIVVNANSTDNTCGKVKSYILKNSHNNIKLISLKNIAFPGRARNFGVMASDSDYVAFIDCGILPDKYWLERLTAPFEKDKNIDVVWGKRKWNYSSSWEKSFITTIQTETKNIRYVSSSCIKKEEFYKANMFREDLRACEDILYVNKIKKMGLKEVFTDAVTCYTGYPTSVSKVYDKWKLYSNYNVIAGVYKKKLLYILIQLSFYTFLTLYKFPRYLILVLLFQIIRTLICIKKSPVRMSNIKEYVNTFIIINAEDAGRVSGMISGLKKKLFSK